MFNASTITSYLVMRFCYHTLLVFTILVLSAGCEPRKAETFYRGGTLPRYKLAVDGRYYPVDENGNFYALPHYQRDLEDFDAYYTLPRGAETYEFPAPYVPKKSSQKPVALPHASPDQDSDTEYSLPTSSSGQEEPEAYPHTVPSLPAKPSVPSVPMPMPTEDQDTLYTLPYKYETPEDAFDRFKYYDQN